MAPPKTSIPTAAKPKFGDHFDAFNSSSTGHQLAENRLGGSTGWRQSRTMKLTQQFESGLGGGKRISDTVGAGSKDWDDKVKALIPDEVRTRAKISVVDMLTHKSSVGGLKVSAPYAQTGQYLNDNRLNEALKPSPLWQNTEDNINTNSTNKRGIFHGLVVYINGSTHPLISDHKLKHLLAENGAQLAIHLGRRFVTHVILGNPCGAASGGRGAGGGLAGTKIQKEIQKIGGCGVKYVGAEWVLESMRQGKRLPETRFSNLKTATKGQKSVYTMFSKNEGE